MLIPVILLLSENGDSLSLKVHGEGFRDVKSTDNIHPDLKAATACKTHKAVLNFLSRLQGNENFKPFHMDNPFHSHICAAKFKTERGIAHYCPLSNMIPFVLEKIEKVEKRSKL